MEWPPQAARCCRILFISEPTSWLSSLSGAVGGIRSISNFVTGGYALSRLRFRCHALLLVLMCAFRTVTVAPLVGGTKRCPHFSEPPSVLTLQVERFINHPGVINKRRDPFDVDDILVIPIFSGAGMQVKVVRYQLAATITHHGEHPRTGHYTAQLFAGPHMWSCDDNRRAHQVRASMHSHASDCYLLIYTRIAV